MGFWRARDESPIADNVTHKRNEGEGVALKRNKECREAHESKGSSIYYGRSPGAWYATTFDPLETRPKLRVSPLFHIQKQGLRVVPISFLNHHHGQQCLNTGGPQHILRSVLHPVSALQM